MKALFFLLILQAFLYQSIVYASSGVEVERIIENAPNPKVEANIFSYHHFALNRKIFDNTEIGAFDNLLGLSLKSSHPVFSENIAGQVKYYYDKGEKPNGTTTNVWNFFMNADGMPSSYVPSTENNKFCMYFHRRYSLPQIAGDAANAITNFGAVTAPDQWWIQVAEIWDDNGNFSERIGPDYLVKDHPSGTSSKYAELARNQKAIQTHSNEKWCVGYAQPVVIKIIKGKKFISEQDVVWDTEPGKVLDPLIKVANVTGYAHFPGAAKYATIPEEAIPNTIYLGMDYLRLLLDLDGLESDPNLNFDKTKYITENTLKGLKTFWGNFIKLGFSSNSEDIFSVTMKEVMNNTALSQTEKFKLLKRNLKSLQLKELYKELKMYPVNKFKGTVYGGNFTKFKNIKTIIKDFRMKGVKSTLSGLRLQSLKKIVNGKGPEFFISLALNLWDLGAKIRNPGNATEAIIIYYIPGMMDGMTLFVDTSTTVNNFHLVSNRNGAIHKSYNTSGFPEDIFYEHIKYNIGIETKDNKACFYHNDDTETGLSYCVNLGEEIVPQAYASMITLPENYWLKIAVNNGDDFYITESLSTDQYLSSLATYFLNRGDVKLSLVKAGDLMKNNAVCMFFDNVFSGVAQCKNSGEFILNDLSVWSQKVQTTVSDLSAYIDKFAVKSIAINPDSTKGVRVKLANGKEFEVINDIPFNVFEISNPFFIESLKITDSSTVFESSTDKSASNIGICQNLAWNGSSWYWKNMIGYNANSCQIANSNCNSGGSCFQWQPLGNCQHLGWNGTTWAWSDFSSYNKTQCISADRCSSGGVCFRWFIPSHCEHLKNIDGNFEWTWTSYSTKNACQSVDKCSTGGACFKWVEGQ